MLNFACGPRAPAQLTCAGAFAAAFVGVGTIFSSYAFGGLLMAFFVSCSLLSRLAGGVKARLDAEYKKDGQRDWVQVMCNGAVPTALALLYGYTINWGHVPFLHGCVASIVYCVLAGALERCTAQFCNPTSAQQLYPGAYGAGAMLADCLVRLRPYLYRGNASA